MAGEVLADDNSPMMMTVDQYNERVARTWNLAIAAEQERIIQLLEDKDKLNNEPCEHSPKDFYAPCGMCQPHLEPKEIIALIKEEN